MTVIASAQYVGAGPQEEIVPPKPEEGVKEEDRDLQKPNLKDVTFYTCVTHNGTTTWVRITAPKEGTEDFERHQMKMESMRAAVNWIRLQQLKGQSLEGFSTRKGLVFDLTNFRMFYITQEEIHKPINIDDMDKDLKEDLFMAASDLHQDLQGHPHIASHRGLKKRKPLDINNQEWLKTHQNIHLGTYKQNHHRSLDERLKASLDDEIKSLRTNALNKTNMAALFIISFRKRIKDRIIQLTDITKSQPPLEKATLGELFSEIAKLQTLDKRLANLDTQAIYRSVPFANDDLKTPLTDEQLKKRKAFSQKEMLNHLLNQPWVPSKHLRYLEAYSHDKAELLVHDALAYEQAVDERGGAPKGSCLEEFFVFNILNLCSKDEESIDEAMKSLQISSKEKEQFTDPELRILLFPKSTAERDPGPFRPFVYDAIYQTRKEVRDEYLQINLDPNEDPAIGPALDPDPELDLEPPKAKPWWLY